MGVHSLLIPLRASASLLSLAVLGVGGLDHIVHTAGVPEGSDYDIDNILEILVGVGDI